MYYEKGGGVQEKVARGILASLSFSPSLSFASLANPISCKLSNISKTGEEYLPAQQHKETQRTHHRMNLQRKDFL